MTKTKKKLPRIAMCSGGKDSVATLILAHIHGIKLDEVIYAEVMFNKTISGELPEHAEFIHGTLKPWVENVLGVPFTILQSKDTYKSRFLGVMQSGQHKGSIRGYPLRGRCYMNRDGKLNPVSAYLKANYSDGFIQYVGIAPEETPRVEHMKARKNQRSLLCRYGYSEEMAKQLCREYGLLSPVYLVTNRNGCWFCPNASDNELAHMVNNHLDIVNAWLSLEFRKRKCSCGFTKYSLEESLLSRIYRLERKGLVHRRLVWVDFTGVGDAAYDEE